MRATAAPVPVTGAPTCPIVSGAQPCRRPRRSIRGLGFAERAPHRCGGRPPLLL